VTSSEFRERLSGRAAHAGVAIASTVESALEAYFQLLSRWNSKINLTALPLIRPTDETFDRLLIEPIVASHYVEDSARSWMDVGSGGGSPAIPLKILRPGLKLTMTESTAKKAAFLRETVRLLSLADVIVENQRFEAVAKQAPANSIDLVSVRAVRSDSALSAEIYRLLSDKGHAFFFHSGKDELLPSPVFERAHKIRLGTTSDARLSILVRKAKA